MRDLKVVILTNSPLTSLGLRALMAESLGVTPMVSDMSFLNSASTSREPDIFIVDASILMARLSFFLPRKAKTLVLTTGESMIEEFITLNTNGTQDEIVASLSNFYPDTNVNEEKSTTMTLTQREIEVLHLIASGRINKEIAQELNISINTVLTHRKNITAKLGIKSVSGLSFYAMMNGII